ncbi:hypothetical protein [Massilia oculi]|uniref:hypothetical protein n=1 Tax=Massilia oculi TaxID=945844 RepID=UPI0028AC2F51|nr:hypothetical protein [Massilia oculi]
MQKIGFNMHLNGTKIRVEPEEIERYAAEHGLDQLIPGRYSSLFVFNLMSLERVSHIDVTPVIKEIQQLEGRGAGLQMKPATEFTGDRLKGLWHQHFFVTHPSALAQNILNQLRGGRLEALAKQHLSAEGPLSTSAIRDFTDALVTGSLEERAEAGRLTGEWIIFANEDKGKFYLSIETHNQDDNVIAQNLRTACLPQFPFLSKYPLP